MLFVLGIIFIIISISIAVYNRPKNKSVAEAILDSGDNLYIEKAKKGNLKKNNIKPKKKRKKKKVEPAEPGVVIGDDCSDSLECPKPYPDNGNKNEHRCRLILQEIYGKPFPSVRPKWLKNPATKRNLELDMYCHRLEFINNKGVKKVVRLACEYDGKQHTAMTQFHGSKRELLYQMQRDKWKNLKCKKLGVTLLRVPYWAKEDLKGYITRSLDSIGLLPK
jgi:hypothetical protein